MPGNDRRFIGKTVQHDLLARSRDLEYHAEVGVAAIIGRAEEVARLIQDYAGLRERSIGAPERVQDTLLAGRSGPV